MKTTITFLSLISLMLLLGYTHKCYGKALTISTIQHHEITSESNKWSEQLLSNIKDQKDTEDIRYKLSEISVDKLAEDLDTDEKKLAFWINVYNSYIIFILREEPELYDDRRSFFAKKQIPIAQNIFSFEDLEHGIIRRSQLPLGLGYIKKLFPGKIERRLRVKNRDHRVHFALNCGAESCPPVTIYNPREIMSQFEYMSDLFLKNMSSYDSVQKTVHTTPIFSWFRGDFGGKRGIKRILYNRGITDTKKVNIKYNDYSWELKLDNFIEITKY